MEELTEKAVETALDFTNICKELNALLTQKNRAYGTSVNDTYKDYGITAYAIRLQDKVNRLKTLIKNPDISKGDEKIEDTLMDLAGYAILAVTQLRNEKEHYNGLVTFAESELNILLEQAKKEGDESASMQDLFNKNILDVVRTFSEGGHSGLTANLALQYIDRLLRYKPLTHLTLEDDEFVEVADGVYQNIRCSNVFKQKDRFDGKPYCIDGPNGEFVTLEEYPRVYFGDFRTAKEIEEDRKKEEEETNAIEA